MLSMTQGDFAACLLFMAFNAFVAHRNMKWSDRLFAAERRKGTQCGVKPLQN